MVKNSFRAGRTVLVLFTMVISAASGKATSPLTEADVIVALADRGVSSHLRQAMDDAEHLSTAIGNLCTTSDSAALTSARTAWRDAWLSYKRAEPFLFDSADKLTQQLGNWPVNHVVLDAVASSAKYSHASKEPSVRGFPAAEYLLFSQSDVAEATAGERCAHLTDTSNEIVELLSTVRNDWEREMKSSFVSAGDGKPFLTQGDALSMAVTRVIRLTEHTLRDGIGVPSGFFRMGAEGTRPDNLEAWRSQNTADGFMATLEGIRTALAGEDASMVNLVATKDGLVESKDPALAAAMRKQMDKIEKTIAGLGGSERLHRDPMRLKNLYKQFQQLQNQIIDTALVLELNVNILELGARNQFKNE